MRVALLTEAGPSFGFGHFGRCAALYDEFELRGCSPTLCVRGCDSLPVGLVESRRVTFGEWIDCPLDATSGCRVVVVDSYHAPREVYEALSDHRAGLWIDDEARLDYPPGIVLNSGITSRRSMYPTDVGVLYLLGAAYHPLRAPFRRSPGRRFDRLSRAMVVFGGTDVRSLGRQMAHALSGVVDDVDLVTDCRTAEAMAAAMRAADVAVSAAGQTVFELAASGTPTIAVVAADNQRDGAEGWRRTGFAVVSGTWRDRDIVQRVLNSVKETADPQRRQRAALAGAALIDGQGAARVVSKCIAMARASGLRMREARATDSEAVLGVSNDPTVRMASFCARTISPSRHDGWFRRRLEDPDTVFLVLEDDSGIMGQVRYQLVGNEAEVSISLASRLQGEGLALPLLERSIRELAERRGSVEHVVAKIRPDNVLSQKLFSNDGFEPSGRTEWDGKAALRFVRRLRRG